MNILYFNGATCSNLSAVSLYNPTFLYGINCFEGIRAYWSDDTKGLIFLDLTEHISRLYSSAKHLALTPPLSSDRLRDEILQIAEHEKIQEDVYVRITFFLGGNGSWHSSNDIHYMISFRSLPSELGTRAPAALGVSWYRRISSQAMPPFVKAGANYLNSRYGMLDVRARGFDDALFLTADDLVSEATGSTIFFFKKGELFTPSLDCDILPGITRARIIKLCREDGLLVHEVKIPKKQLSAYDGAILTGTMVEIRPVVRLEAWYYDPKSALHDRLIRLFREYVYHAAPDKSLVSFRGLASDNR